MKVRLSDRCMRLLRDKFAPEFGLPKQFQNQDGTWTFTLPDQIVLKAAQDFRPIGGSLSEGIERMLEYYDKEVKPHAQNRSR